MVTPMIRGWVYIYFPKQNSILFRHFDIPVEVVLIWEHGGVTLGRLSLWHSCLSKWLTLGACFPLTSPGRLP